MTRQEFVQEGVRRGMDREDLRRKFETLDAAGKFSDSAPAAKPNPSVQKIRQDPRLGLPPMALGGAPEVQPDATKPQPKPEQPKPERKPLEPIAPAAGRAGTRRQGPMSEPTGRVGLASASERGQGDGLAGVQERNHGCRLPGSPEDGPARRR
jgi:hypothetical protein